MASPSATSCPAPAATPGGAEGSEESATTTEEVTNYEISKRTTTEIREAGSVRRLSVAVLVDGIYSEAADGSANYSERPGEQLEQIATLVRTAIGFDAERGDNVEVVNLRFAPEARPQTFDDGAGAGLGMSTSDYLRIFELVMLAFVALVLIVFVIRPLLRSILSNEPAQQQLSGPASTADVEGQDALEGPGTERALPSPEAPRAKVDEVIEFSKISGEVQENAIRKVADLVKGNPEEAVAIMRQWMQTST